MSFVKTKLLPIEQKTITTAGTRVQCNSGTSRQATTVILQALTGNSGNVFVGDSTVAAAAGIQLAPGASITLNADEDLENEDKTYIDLADLWFDTATNGNKINVLVVDVISIAY